MHFVQDDIADCPKAFLFSVYWTLLYHVILSKLVFYVGSRKSFCKLPIENIIEILQRRDGTKLRQF